MATVLPGDVLSLLLVLVVFAGLLGVVELLDRA